VSLAILSHTAECAMLCASRAASWCPTPSRVTCALCLLLPHWQLESSRAPSWTITVAVRTGNTIGDAGAAVIASSLEKNATLVFLNVEGALHVEVAFVAVGVGVSALSTVTCGAGNHDIGEIQDARIDAFNSSREVRVAVTRVCVPCMRRHCVAACRRSAIAHMSERATWSWRTW
jgi:hypothetical protein